MPFVPVHQVNPASGGYVPPPVTSSNNDDDLPRTEDGEVDYNQIRLGMEGLRRRMNRVADDIQQSRDRLDVLDIQRRYLGQENEGQIELPPNDDDDVINVLDSNWADQQIITSDSTLSDEDMGMLPNPQVQQRDPLWQRLGRRLFPINPPLVQNPKYYLPKPQPQPQQPDPIPTPTPAPAPDPIIPPTPIPTREEEEPYYGTDTVVWIDRGQQNRPQQKQQTIDLFPIFVSGMALASFILGIPFFIL